MNKLALPLAIIALIASIATFLLSQSKSDLVYVDVNELIEGYDRTKLERVSFDEKAKTLTSNVDSLANNWQNELKKYEAERPNMSKKEIALQQELLTNKQQQLNNYQQAIQKQIQEENQKMTQTIVNDINDFIKEYGKQHGYPIIFGAGGNGNIMYAEDKTDLTAKVLEGLNKQFNGD
jgi:outer membrane protein